MAGSVPGTHGWKETSCWESGAEDGEKERERLAYSACCALKGQSWRETREKEAFCLGETSHFNFPGGQGGFLGLVSGRKKGIPGRGTGRFKAQKCESAENAPDKGGSVRGSESGEERREMGWKQVRAQV